ncbi:M56 family metallopeptidase, partial [Segatella hominis]
MYPSTLEGRQLHEVMVHECTHVSGHHSLDTLFSELFSIACWFNPFVWLMKQEVRMNLEYLADESVLSDGNARKSYQYHLLGLAYRQPNESTKIANNFNLLPLKKR